MNVGVVLDDTSYPRDVRLIETQTVIVQRERERQMFRAHAPIIQRVLGDDRNESFPNISQRAPRVTGDRGRLVRTEFADLPEKPIDYRVRVAFRLG